jgi:hypothetical protein
MAFLKCADLSALWYAATRRRKAGDCGVSICPRQVAAYESGNKFTALHISRFAGHLGITIFNHTMLLNINWLNYPFTHNRSYYGRDFRRFWVNTDR